MLLMVIVMMIMMIAAMMMMVMITVMMMMMRRRRRRGMKCQKKYLVHVRGRKRMVKVWIDYGDGNKVDNYKKANFYF